MFKFLVSTCLIFPSLWGVEYQALTGYLQNTPFHYDLCPLTFEGKKTDSPVCICCHGYSGDERIASALRSYGDIDTHLLGFRFPDHGAISFLSPPELLSYGSINELLPLLYLLKVCAVEADADIDLYGFSAGGAAVINALAVLADGRFSEELAHIGIQKKEREKILEKLEAGLVILDCPLKSVEEVIAFRGVIGPLEFVKESYAKNDLRPIDSIQKLSSLKLHILLYFEDPDLVISNRDDNLFIERLKIANQKGKTYVRVGTTEGHVGYHTPLWDVYRSCKRN